MREQNSRCGYCGIELVLGTNATLDHVLPHHLGDDPYDGRNWVFACGRCNSGKGALPHYSLGGAGANWIAADAGDGLTDAVRFAVLA